MPMHSHRLCQAKRGPLPGQDSNAAPLHSLQQRLPTPPRHGETPAGDWQPGGARYSMSLTKSLVPAPEELTNHLGHSPQRRQVPVLTPVPPHSRRSPSDVNLRCKTCRREGKGSAGVWPPLTLA